MTVKRNYSTMAVEVVSCAPTMIRYKRVDSGLERLHFTRDGLEQLVTPGTKYLVTAHVSNDIWDWVKVVEMNLGKTIVDKEPK